MILRLGEEKGISSVSPVKLTMILRNQIGDIHMAKVLRDGNLLIVCRNEGQRERAGRIKGSGYFTRANWEMFSFICEKELDQIDLSEDIEEVDQKLKSVLTEAANNQFLKVKDK